jgi:hypothetical protein
LNGTEASAMRKWRAFSAVVNSGFRKSTTVR